MLNGVDITEVSPDDADAVASFVAVANAVRRHDAPWVHPLTERECVGLLRHNWDGEPPVAFLAHAGGGIVGLGELHTSERDNRDLAWLEVEVHPDHRRRGHGSALIAALIERAGQVGRTSFGMDGWDGDATRVFAHRQGFTQKSIAVNRRQLVAELDWDELDARYAEARSHAAAYDLVRLAGEVPDDELAAFAVMVSAINDAPLDDLEIEDEVYSPERVRAYEHAHEARGIRLHRVVARHHATGELAGQTAVAVEQERPQLGEQHDTSVVTAHRGHRLGLLLKIEMLRWLREAQPQLVSVDTWNAESNAHMIDVNRALGYRVLGRSLVFQRV